MKDDNNKSNRPQKGGKSMDMIQLKKHNCPPYERLLQAMRTTGHAIYVSGVGTGKSFVCMKLLQDSGLYDHTNCLYIVPQESIAHTIAGYPEFAYVKDRITFCNMQQFTSPEKAQRLINGYGLVVMDEHTIIGLG